MSIAKFFANQPDAMPPVKTVEGIYVIKGSGIEQIGNLLSAVATYNGAGSYTLTGLVVGQTYVFTLGSNDTSLTHGSAVPVDGVIPQKTYVTSAEFIATATTATLTGTASQTIKSTVIPKVWVQKLWLYPAKAVSSGILTSNGANIYVGRSGAVSTQYVPDLLQPSDLPLKYELPLGQKMALSQILIKGTAGDGVFYQYT